jgi:hypothetical protein
LTRALKLVGSLKVQVKEKDLLHEAVGQ